MSTDATPTNNSLESRSGNLPAGAHGRVSVWVDLARQREYELYYHIKAEYPGQVGAYVRYRGHKDDLIAASCVSAELLASGSYTDFNPIDERTLVTLESKAGPGQRGWLEVCYLAVGRPFAEAFPGVRELYPEGLPRTWPPDSGQARRPRLRLVVDNTRDRP
jgi:hypothetical protein